MKHKPVPKGYQSRIKSAELFAQIEQVLKDPAVFSDPKLSRKSVAGRLGSNEAYVREAILDHIGLTFSAYITGIRLAYARELLLCPNQIYLVSDIVNKCGLGTASTFYRLFKKDCGMTPEEYRNYMDAKNNHTS